METKGGWATAIDADLAGFIAGMRSFYLATANKDGQPYIQHRGGPAGFLHVLDEKTLAFADFSGNRQYITTGNLAENPKAHLFVMVSHDLDSLQKLCDRLVWMDHGHVRRSGPSAEIIAAYRESARPAPLAA